MSNRGNDWPTPFIMAVQMKGTFNVPNLYKINDNLYGSAQPTAEGMKQLKQVLGIKTIINLRTFHSDADEIGSTTGMTKEEAIDEMVTGGYGFNSQWTNIIKYIQSADIDKLKRAIQAK